MTPCLEQALSAAEFRGRTLASETVKGGCLHTASLVVCQESLLWRITVSDNSGRALVPWMPSTTLELRRAGRRKSFLCAGRAQCCPRGRNRPKPC